MCLRTKGYRMYTRLARNLDDEKPQVLDVHYGQNT